MPGDNELKPLDVSAVKAATSRIDLSKATIPVSPGTGGIRIGANPKKATSRIDINAIPGAGKAATSRVGLGAMPPADEDVFKRRTARTDAPAPARYTGEPEAAAAPVQRIAEPRFIALDFGIMGRIDPRTRWLLRELVYALLVKKDHAAAGPSPTPSNSAKPRPTSARCGRPGCWPTLRPPNGCS